MLGLPPRLFRAGLPVEGLLEQHLHHGDIARQCGGDERRLTGEVHPGQRRRDAQKIVADRRHFLRPRVRIRALVEQHLDHVLTLRFDPRSHVVRVDGKLAPTAVDHDQKLDLPGPAEVHQGGDRRPDGSSREEHVIDENDPGVVHGEGELGLSNDGLRGNRREVVAVEGDVERPNRRLRSRPRLEGPGETARVLDAGEAIMRLCVDVGGSVTGEHGIGLEKRDFMPWIFSDADVAAMSKLKYAFGSDNPDGDIAQAYFNPCKAFPTSKGCGEVHTKAAIAALGPDAYV